MVNLWKRSMSITPTAGRAAPNSSGRWVMQAPTSSPPLLPPWIASSRGNREVFPNKPLAAGDEVIEDILLAEPGAGEVPFAAVLAAAAQVRHGEDAAAFQPHGAGDRETRASG